jgi:hypothetical protein
MRRVSQLREWLVARHRVLERERDRRAVELSASLLLASELLCISVAAVEGTAQHKFLCQRITHCVSGINCEFLWISP